MKTENPGFECSDLEKMDFGESCSFEIEKNEYDWGFDETVDVVPVAVVVTSAGFRPGVVAISAVFHPGVVAIAAGFCPCAVAVRTL